MKYWWHTPAFLLALLASGRAVALEAIEPDPIAYKCYFCTEDEMRDVALVQGIGVHYVYDYDLPYITGYSVEIQSGELVATRFDAEEWVIRHFLSLREHFRPGEGVLKFFENVQLYAPGSDHGRGPGDGQYIKGHHLSALYPQHTEARETVRRYLDRHGDFGFLDAHDSGGRLLQLQVMREMGYPVVAAISFESYGFNSDALYHFDYASRRWVFAEANDINRMSVQNSTEDFFKNPTTTYYPYAWTELWFRNAFVERATWAGVPIRGDMPPGNVAVRFACSRTTLECSVN